MDTIEKLEELIQKHHMAISCLFIRNEKTKESAIAQKYHRDQIKILEARIKSIKEDSHG